MSSSCWNGTGLRVEGDMKLLFMILNIANSLTQLNLEEKKKKGNVAMTTLATNVASQKLIQMSSSF